MSVLILSLSLGPWSGSVAQEKDEETYSISLTQTAEPEIETEQEIRVVEKKESFTPEGKKVVLETYTVKKGDHLWQILRQRGLLEKKNLPEFLAALKKLNSSFSNLDVIHPGDKIVIPLTIVPVKGLPAVARATEETVISMEQLKDLKLEDYTVQQGDSLIKVVKGRYSLTDDQVNEAYLHALARLNPEISNLDRVYPGQVVRLPVYTPQLVRLPVKREKPPRPVETAQAPAPAPATKPEQPPTPPALSRQLTEFFALLGEDWINTGEHFIPLKAGGQLNLKAEAFPILSLGNGQRVIVDLHRELPEKMAQVITANWDNYKVIHLKGDEDLRSALNKILAACDYYKIYKRGEPLEMRGDFTLQVNADWIIQTSEHRGQTLLINLADKSGARIPPELMSFLTNYGVKSIEYPPTQQGNAEPAAAAPKSDVLFAGKDKAAVIESVLNLTGQTFTRDVEMPVIQGQKGGVSLMVKADFFLYVNGKDSIIDSTGIGPDIVPLLKEYKVSVLSLSNEQDPEQMVLKLLDFIGVKFDSREHPFTAGGKDDSKNFKLLIPGIVFKDNRGQNVFASHLKLPDDIAGFLSRRGYKVLSLAVS
ncbi:MAG: LysM peptidoglycan-binding domain-containing protein [Deltaproteobacteria bacterium]